MNKNLIIELVAVIAVIAVVLILLNQPGPESTPTTIPDVHPTQQCEADEDCYINACDCSCMNKDVVTEPCLVKPDCGILYCKCLSGACEGIVEELFPEPPEPIIVTYNHPSGAGAADRDCFDDSELVCLTREINRPVFNAGTDTVRWGCGACGAVTQWFDELDISFKEGCAGGKMPGIKGKELCLETSSGNWNIEFSEWEVGKAGGAGGGFAYTRTKA